MEKAQSSINFSGRQKEKLSQILGRYLSQSSLGKKIISQFRGNKDRGAEALIAYLDQTLPDDPKLSHQIADILGEEHRQQFINIVTTGGSVGEIINIGQLGELSIRYYIFSDVRQVIAMLLGLVVIGGAIGYASWWTQQPRRMTGDFNIAVAEFSQAGESKLGIAESVSQKVFRYLDDQANLITFEDVQVSHKNIGLISNAQEARELAERIHAQVVIYGDVTTIGDQVNLTPQFYIAEAFRADVSELNGQQRLAAPITFPLESILTPSSDSMKLIQERTTIMTEFTKALVYLATDNLLLSQEAIDQAILHSEQQVPFEGQEVIYLFASEIAHLQGDQESAQVYVDKALTLNPGYGRGYIAKANIYYDEGYLFQAKENYEKAQRLPGQPFGAHVVEKASLGIGNSCWVQLQHVRQNPVSDQLGSSELEQCALMNYQKVIDLYLQQKNPETNLKEMAARAYYTIGAIEQGRDRTQDAQRSYEQALKLTTDQKLIQLIETGLQDVKQ